MSTPLQILVRGPNWLGDQVLVQPAYQALRAAYPRAHLAWIGPQALKDLPGNECFDEQIALTPEDRRFPGGVWRLGRRLGTRRIDLGVTFPASYSSSFLLWAAGIRHRAGFATGGSDWFLTYSRRWDGRASGKHKSRLYLDLVEAITARPAPSFEPAGTSAKREPLIIIAPGAALPLRVWPHFTELLHELRSRYPTHRLAMVGTENEGKWHGFLKRWGPSSIDDLIGKTSLPELVALCGRARLVIANDSGVAHLAATLANAPTIVLFGPGDPDYVKPMGHHARVVRASGIACSPCESARCQAPYGYQSCLRELRVVQVMAEVQSVLSL